MITAIEDADLVILVFKKITKPNELESLELPNLVTTFTAITKFEITFATLPNLVIIAKQFADLLT